VSTATEPPRASGDTEPPRAGGAGRRVLRAAGVVAAVAFLALLAYGLTTKSANTTIDDALSRGTAVDAPGFELAALAPGRPAGAAAAAWGRASHDGRVGLGELRGTPVVVNFWASWCDPCRGEARVLERGWRESGGRDVLFLGLDGQDATEDAHDFIRQFGLTFPHVRDPTNATARAWGVTGLPETFFVAAGGRVVGHVIGTIGAAQLRAGVAAARAGRPAGAQRGGEQRPTR
jgi:cytochrome c biogenesis protein CcmG/thiol:disulfide interchange protein DsbE